jgi:macrodomain Ter protein organizer (MatP/YcbG family)
MIAIAIIERENLMKLTKKSSLIERLQIKPKEGTKRFTIDLRESVHRKLSILAAKTGRTKADIVRMLLDDALEGIVLEDLNE